MSYGILAFEVGSKGSFIPQSISNNNIHLNVYSTIDSLNNIYTTIVNKDTLTDGFIELNAGNNSYINSAYILLSAATLSDTTNITLGGQTVNADGICPAYTWHNLGVSNHICKLLVKSGSAAIIRFSKTASMSIDNMYHPTSEWVVYPNPIGSMFYVRSNTSASDTRLIIYDLLGKICYSTYTNESSVLIDATELTNGIYFLQIVSAGKVVSTQKLIRE